MKLRTLVWRELFERKNQLATTFMAVLLGISVVVAIKNITHYSEKAVARELDALGANILILPKSTTLQDYYAADLQGEEIPEEYVQRLTSSDLKGLDNLSPKLSLPCKVGGLDVSLTGILPAKEFQAKASWEGAGIFSRPQGCGIVPKIPGITSDSTAKATLARKRVVSSLAANEVLVGAEVAETLHLAEGTPLEIMGRTFNVTAVLPPTGTVDDSRVFAHLHTVQKLAGKGAVVNVIEVVGCCNEISKGLVLKINRLLPEAKVVTIAQIVDTQIKTNSIMAHLSVLLVIIMVLIGGASIANYMYANVYERRREIGSLIAMGAEPQTIQSVFLLKGLLVGSAGGLGGYVSGTLLAMILGPYLAGVPVFPMPVLVVWALGIAVGISLLACILPARRAAHLDPSTILMEG